MILLLGWGIAVATLALIESRPSAAYADGFRDYSPDADIRASADITPSMIYVSRTLPVRGSYTTTPGALPQPITPCAILSRAPAPVDERRLFAFYYPWYDLSFWPRTFLTDTPLFPYNSNDPDAIARHIAWAQAAGLDGFIVSWSGWEYSYFDGNFALVLNQMAGAGLSAAIYFESLTPNFTSTAKIISELEYVLNNHSAHPSFLRWDGRPVIFLYAIDYVARDSGVTAFEVWQTVVNQLHADGYNPFLIGDTLNSAYLSIFDGLHTYFALQDISVYRSVSCQAHQAGKLWAADIYPGFDDRLLYWRDPYHIYIPRNNGRTYSDTFANALESVPDWILVTSFNEWYENTHIEPSVRYGYDYVSQTASLAARFDAWRSLATVYVDAAYAGPVDGSAARPYNTLSEAVMAAQDGATLRVAGGVYSGPITLTLNITMEGGYDPLDWTRHPADNPTMIQGDGTGPVVRARSEPCLSSSPLVVLDGLVIAGGGAQGAAPTGGGLDVQDASLTLVNSRVTGNLARDYGGGIYIENGRLKIEASYILSNTASVGGGLFVGDRGRAWLTNTVVARNQATIAGGGLYARLDRPVYIVNSTLAGNASPGNGAGLYAWPLSRTVTITNSIVWGNGGNDLRCLGNCVITFSDVAGDWPGAGNLDADPLFRDPAGGDYHLLHDSPAINAGDPAGVQPQGPAPITDIDGELRPVGLGVDMGADEFGPLAWSIVSVDKPIALPGDILNYTITLTNTDLFSLRFWVTDTLPLLTDYVTGSLRAVSGTAIYTSLVGTLFLPRVYWTGAVSPGESISLSFAVTVQHSITFCTDIVNHVLIQTANSAVRRSATSHISSALHHLVIRDAPGGSGNTVDARTLQPGQTITLHAASYDACNGYLGPISATWRTTGTLEFREGHGVSFAFAPALVGGQGIVVADDGQGHVAETGLITVAYAAPQIGILPSFLSSTQLRNTLVTRTLTISNGPGLTLTYAIASDGTAFMNRRPFELTYEWDASSFIRAVDAQGQAAWSYYFTPEQIDRRLAGGEIQVTEIEVESSGINLANWVNWDWEAHLSNRRIGLPEGQMVDSGITPWDGYTRDAPTRFSLTIGEVNDPRSFVYRANHNFVTGATTAIPFYSKITQDLSTPMDIADGLHAQVFFWTGDPRVAVQFDRVHLVVRGMVTNTWPLADWLTLTPVSGTLGPSASQVVNAVFSSKNHGVGSYNTTLMVQSNDPDEPVSTIPAALTITDTAWLYLPVMMRNAN